MGFDSINFSPKEKHEIQPALKNIVQKLVHDLEEDIHSWETGDYKSPAMLRYKNMSVDTLIKLHMAIGGLGSQIDRIKKQFILDEKTVTVLDETKNLVNNIIHSEQEVELIKKWEIHNQSGHVKVDTDLANTLGNEMYNLEENLKKLKEVFNLQDSRRAA